MDYNMHRTQFSWKKGFLMPHKPPIQWPTPGCKPHHRLNSIKWSHHQNTTVPMAVDNKGAPDDYFWTANKQEGVITPVTHMAMLLGSSPTTGQSSESPQPTFLQCYDLRICLYGAHEEVYSEWKALANFLVQLQAINNKIRLLPWQEATEQDHNPTMTIAQCINSFFDFHTYVPQSASKEVNLRTWAMFGWM